MITLFCIVIISIIVILIAIGVYKSKKKREYRELLSRVYSELGIKEEVDNSALAILKSSASVEKYTVEKYFQEHNSFNYVLKTLETNHIIKTNAEKHIKATNNLQEFSNNPRYDDMMQDVKETLKSYNEFIIIASYTSPAGKVHKTKNIRITYKRILEFKNHPEWLMSKAEYNRYLKKKDEDELNNKKNKYFDRINILIELANNLDSDEFTDKINILIYKTVPTINKIKAISNNEWDIIDSYISGIEDDINTVVARNKMLDDYYNSQDFQNLRSICNKLMESQKDFNSYINDKYQSIKDLFGVRNQRDETEHNDKSNFIRPFKKTISPFNADVSESVFASAENNPIAYVVKMFYPDKSKYPEQIQKLQMLITELQTLNEAKNIINSYKDEYQKYFDKVPDYILEYDKNRFYSNLGFAIINEDNLTFNYRFTYTSNGGYAQKSFTVPMNEENIISIINILSNKLTYQAFAKEQRTLMNKKLREKIKYRDNYTCCHCGISLEDEPHLLLEVDHIVPVAKGGLTTEENLQTLCWKCNRSKSDKI